MRRILIAAGVLMLMSGCTGTRSIVREYGADGKLTRETESSESVIRT